jgi:hypothetical protein
MSLGQAASSPGGQRPRLARSNLVNLVAPPKTLALCCPHRGSSARVSNRTGCPRLGAGREGTAPIRSLMPAGWAGMGELLDGLAVLDPAGPAPSNPSAPLTTARYQEQDQMVIDA